MLLQAIFPQIVCGFYHVSNIFLYCSPDFLVAPPETVLIPKGGGANLPCIYVDPQGFHRPVNWRRLDGDDCNCYSRKHENGFGSSVTFFNFTLADVGEYGCWATIPVDSDANYRCMFDVILAGKHDHCQ